MPRASPPCNALGRVWVFQVEPPSVVPITTVPSVVLVASASHTPAEGQMIVLRFSVPDGTFCAVHVTPPLVVPTMAGLPVEWLLPTPSQTVADGQAM